MTSLNRKNKLKSWVILSMFATGFLSVLFASSVVFAESFTKEEQPCLVIKRACSKAGFKKSKDCFKKVLSGQAVSGVSVDSAVISKCKDK